MHLLTPGEVVLLTWHPPLLLSMRCLSAKKRRSLHQEYYPVLLVGTSLFAKGTINICQATFRSVSGVRRDSSCNWIDHCSCHASVPHNSTSSATASTSASMTPRSISHR